MTIVPPRTGSSALAKPLKFVLDDAANPRGKARAVRREILFKDGSSTKMRTPQWRLESCNWCATFAAAASGPLQITRMFTKLAPQKVKHSDGYLVQVANRQCVEYIEPHRKAMIEVDFGNSVGVYIETLNGWLSEAGISGMSATDRERVISGIAAGLEAMGSTVELC